MATRKQLKAAILLRRAAKENEAYCSLFRSILDAD